MPVTYTEDTIHGPEVDFGVAWRLEDGADVRSRVTWLATSEDGTRGDVRTFGWSAPNGILTSRLLAHDIPLFVVEHLLSQPYGKLNFTPANPAHDEDIGWATASLRGETVEWVVRRLRRWEGCEVVHYSGKDYHSGIIKATKAWAAEHGYRGSKGGWIYDSNGEPVVQGWLAFTGMLCRANRILCIKQEFEASGVKDGKFTPSCYTETWIVSQESAGRRDF